MTFRAIVDADLFRRAATCMSTEETRYYLNGVYVHPCDQGGVVMVSTNGHVLVAIRDPEGLVEGGTAIVRLNKAMLKACKDKPAKAEGGRRKLIIDGGTAKVNTEASGFPFGQPDDDGTIAYQWVDTLIDGSFPDYTRVVPNIVQPSAVALGFNSQYISDLAEALGEGRLSGLKIVPGADAYQPTLVLGGSGLIDGFGVLMPMRVQDRSTLPDWFARKSEPESVAA